MRAWIAFGRGMGILPMCAAGILPADSGRSGRARMALRRTGKMPVPRRGRLSYVFLAIGIAAAAVLAAGAGEAPATKPVAANLIRNGSFEVRSGPRKLYPAEPWGYGLLDGVSRSPFAHWGYSGFWDGGDYDIKLGEGRTGRLCARLVCRKRGRGGICTDAIRVRPGTKLRFSGHFKAKGARGPCWVNFEGDGGDGWARIDLPARQDYDWTEVAGEVTVSPPRPQRKPAADGTIAVHVFVYTRAYGELWIDDVSLTPIAEP